ncbi:hypothetical protein [Ponticaulis profundi]
MRQARTEENMQKLERLYLAILRSPSLPENISTLSDIGKWVLIERNILLIQSQQTLTRIHNALRTYLLPEGLQVIPLSHHQTQLSPLDQQIALPRDLGDIISEIAPEHRRTHALPPTR